MSKFKELTTFLSQDIPAEKYDIIITMTASGEGEYFRRAKEKTIGKKNVVCFSQEREGEELSNVIKGIRSTLDHNFGTLNSQLFNGELYIDLQKEWKFYFFKCLENMEILDYKKIKSWKFWTRESYYCKFTLQIQMPRINNKKFYNLNKIMDFVDIAINIMIKPSKEK